MALSKRREVAAATARRRVFGRLNVPLLAIITVALAARVAWTAATDFRPTLTDDAGRYDLLGRSLADNACFVNPNGHLTMYWPPGYPFILAALYKLYPHWLLADHTVKTALLLNALIGTATVALVYAIGVRAFGRKAALAGAAITALFPSLVFFAGVTLSETAFTFLLLLALWLLIEAEARDCRLLIVAGLVVGFASLVRGQALLLPLVALPFWWASAHGHRQVRPGVTAATGATPVMEFEDVSAQPPAWRDLTMRLAVVGGLALLVVAPWTARNYVESHSLVLISSNSGVDFYIGHSAGADGRGRIVNDFVFRYPDLPPAEAEARISNDGFHDGLTYAVHHPLREVTLSARKVFFLYYRDRAAVDWIDSHGERHVLASSLQHALWLLSDAYYYAVIALAVVGVRRWFSLRDPVRLLLVSLAVYWTLVHVAFFADPRFHAPIMPVLALWAGMGVMWGQAQSRRVILSRFKSLAMHEAEG